MNQPVNVYLAGETKKGWKWNVITALGKLKREGSVKWKEFDPCTRNSEADDLLVKKVLARTSDIILAYIEESNLPELRQILKEFSEGKKNNSVNILIFSNSKVCGSEESFSDFVDHIVFGLPKGIDILEQAILAAKKD